MNFTKKLDRAVQWTSEKMGGEAKTAMSDDFKALETEMNLRYDGMDRLQKSMTAYVKWVGRRGETFDDKEKGLPISYLGRTMTSHGEDFEHDSHFGNCLTSLGRANERLASAQERYVADATATWLESLERNLAMLREYQAARKKLENRRLVYDASIGRMQKAKRDDFRIEEELRTNRAKYEESNEDVMRRMQDVKEAEADSIRDLTGFLDCELEYHERCAEELRRVKQSWPAPAPANHSGNGSYGGGRSRSNTARSYNNERMPSYGSRAGAAAASDSSYLDEESEAPPVRMPIRSNTSHPRSSNNSPPQNPARPAIGRANSYQPGSNGSAASSQPPNSFSTYNNPLAVSGSAAAVTSLRTGLRPVGRIQTTNGHPNSGNVFADDNDDTSGGSGSGSPEWGERSASPATSFGSLSRSTSNVAMSSGGTVRKAPPPPPPNRNKKPPPPVPAPRRESNY